jgi:hypothetical protein
MLLSELRTRFSPISIRFVRGVRDVGGFNPKTATRPRTKNGGDFSSCFFFFMTLNHEHHEHYPTTPINAALLMFADFRNDRTSGTLERPTKVPPAPG